MKVTSLVLISIIFMIVSLQVVYCLHKPTTTTTPLEEFVFRKDNNVGQYTLHNKIKNPRFTAYVLNFTSINWLNEKESSNPKWWHWLTICVPNIVLSDYGYLEVEGGFFNSEPNLSPLVEQLCTTSNSIVSQLSQAPNQPMIFNGDGVPRIEDGILAYTWSQFIKNQSNPDCLGQFALTKAVVRAMDMIQRFVEENYLFYNVNKFVVSGGSKRGWASWLAAAVDARIEAVIPYVFPNLNMIQNTNLHYRAYGGWSFSYGDYFEQGLIKYLNRPEFEAVAKHVDPIYYLDKLRTKSKYVVNAVGDEYFLPDSSSLFRSQLLGSTHIRIHPNTGHGLDGRSNELITEINTYYNMIINHQKLPEFDWSIVPYPTTNQTTIYITIKSRCSFQRPTSVIVYQADTLSKTRRDWRYQHCNRTTGICELQGINWVSAPLNQIDDDFYSFTISAPPQGGWRGAFIELTYPSYFGPQRYTTDFFYAPFNFPFENCGLSCDTALEKFIQRPDDNVGQYYIHRTIRNPRYSAYVLNFTSINWLTEKESSNPKWWHYLTICVPNIVLSDYGYLEVGGGDFDIEEDDISELDSTIEKLCISSNSVISHLLLVPNQQLVFNNETEPLQEDALLAYAWGQFIKNQSNTDWIPQFALTKSVIKAMDTIQAFIRSKYFFYRVNNFVVSGASKRGWTSWLAGAVDPRVVAIIPVVFPNLNVIQNSINHYRSFGGWSFAYGDYFTQGLMKNLNTPNFEALTREIDPIYFVDQLRSKSKYIVQGVGDEYFLPDSVTLFWSQLLGVKHNRLHPNSGHQLENRGDEYDEEINTYYNMIINNQRLPEFEWSIVPDPRTNQTTMYVTIQRGCTFQRPTSVVVYQADTLSTTKRDWRYHTFDSATRSVQVQNITWVPTEIDPVDDDEGDEFYKFTVSPPEKGGWRGAFIELTYPSFFGPQRYTTDFFYAPYNFPFENCGLDCGNKPFPL
eukprot:gene1299-1641_t